MVEIVTKEKPTQNKTQPEVRDLSRVVDQTARTLADLDQRLQLMRNDLAQLIQKTASLAPTAPFPNNMGTMGTGYGAAQYGVQQWPSSYGRLLGDAYTSWAGWPVGQVTAGYPTSGMYAQQTGSGSPPGASQVGGATSPGSQFGIGSQRTGTFGSGLAAGMLGQQESPTQFTRDLRSRPPVLHQPRADVIDDGQEFQIDVELPGVSKDTVDIMVAERSVIVKAVSRPEGADGVVVVGERSPVEYRRTIHLPSEIQTGECKATLKDGLLTINVPKKIPTEGPRHINVAYT